LEEIFGSKEGEVRSISNIIPEARTFCCQGGEKRNPPGVPKSTITRHERGK